MYKQLFSLGWSILLLSTNSFAINHPINHDVSIHYLHKLCPQTNQIDVSKDLIKLGIATENLSPNNDKSDAGTLLEQTIQYAANHQISTVFIPAGDYHFKTQRNKAHLFIKNIHNVKLAGKGANFLFYNRDARGLLVESCHHFSVDGITIDYRFDLPFTSGIITSVDVSNKTILFNTGTNRPNTDFKNDKGNYNVWIFVLRKTLNGYKYLTTRLTPLPGAMENGKITLKEKDDVNLLKIAKNDIICISERSFAANHALCIVNYYPELGTDNSVTNVTINSAPAMGIAAKWQKNLTIDHVVVAPLKGRNQYISTNADGIDIANGGEGISITNCTTKMTGDDGISFYCGQMGKVAQVKDNTLTVYLKYAFQTNQHFTSSDPNSLLEKDDIIVQSINRLPDAVPEKGWEGIYSIETNSTEGIHEGDQLFLSEADRMSGTIVKGNTVLQSYARGIFLAGVTGAQITNNVVEQSNSSAIYAQRINESGNGMKSATCSNITIQGNTIRNAFDWGFSWQPGAIESSIMKTKAIAPLATNKNIQIKNNDISFAVENGNNHTGVFVANTKDYSAKTNKVKGINKKGKLVPINGKSAVNISE